MRWSREFPQVKKKPNARRRRDLTHLPDPIRGGATPGSRPKARKGRQYRMARALEFAPLRSANSGSSKIDSDPPTQEPPHVAGALVLAEKGRFELPRRLPGLHP